MSKVSKPQTPRKFYFLDYFYILLKSIEFSHSRDSIFAKFVELKAKHNLGESKYKKLTVDEKDTNRNRYKYTFKQVVSEAEAYDLITAAGGRNQILLKPKGKVALENFESDGTIAFNRFILGLMEEKYNAFRYLISMCYTINKSKSGLLVLPIYSAHRLNFHKSEITTTSDFMKYLRDLQLRLEDDIAKYLDIKRDLTEQYQELLSNLISVGFLSSNPAESYDIKNYNSMLKRVRDYWLKFFLQNLYGFEISLPSFELWSYRAKQFGILHITEFYPDPDFHGKIVYPLSRVDNKVDSPNFTRVYNYPDGESLFLHEPQWEDGDEFVQALTKAYLEARQISRATFVRLANVRERVCYGLKMPEYLFDQYLGKAYTMRDKLKIRISLEADRLPSETNLEYVQREPVMIEGKYRNIIAIDYNKER